MEKQWLKMRRKANFSIPIFSALYQGKEGMVKLAILGSGSGSNMQAILDATEKGGLKAKVHLVVSDDSEAYILKRAQKAGVQTNILDCRGFKTRFPLSEQQRLAALLVKHDIGLVCLAGFMRLIGAPLLEAFPGRILNIHPSLLPQYPGLAAWEQAIQDQATHSGCTVHYVDAGMDTGEVIGQRSVVVSPEDTAITLHQKIQAEERLLYPNAIQQVLGKLGYSRGL